jgi:hypothetical protein
LYYRIHNRLIIAAIFLVLGATLFTINALSGIPNVWRLLMAFASLCSILVSGYFIYTDWRRIRDERFNIQIIDDDNFHQKASSLEVKHGTIFDRINDYFISFDPSINPVIDSLKSPIEIRRPPYQVPFPLRSFMAKAVNKRRPTSDDPKIGLRSDLDLDILSGRIEVQETTYFAGISTNEITPSRVVLINREQNRHEKICTLFEDFVSDNGKLVPLSRSILSNHIGVTTLLITRDPCIALQWQGDTQVDKMKINVGASGSADWRDLARSPAHFDLDGKPVKTLQNVVRYAMEREANEELSAKIGEQFSRTKITGYARYVHRGGKPEFFGITFLNQEYSDLRIRRHEKKWVLTKESRKVRDHSKPAVIDAIASLQEEFDPRRTTAASISMLLCLRFAGEYLRRDDVRFEDIVPPGFSKDVSIA